MARSKGNAAESDKPAEASPLATSGAAGLLADDAPVEVDLRQPWLALFLAWLWPGAGHFYQRRYAKGLLFMVCILGVWFFGLVLGGGHVVYASLPKQERRLHYFAQVLVGAPALPALVQTQRMKGGDEPLFGGLMAPPKPADHFGEVDELAQWHAEYHTLFELGTLYTVIAGLLNVLAMYDAFAGPAYSVKEEESTGPPPDGGTGDVKNKPD